MTCNACNTHATCIHMYDAGYLQMTCTCTCIHVDTSSLCYFRWHGNGWHGNAAMIHVCLYACLHVACVLTRTCMLLAIDRWHYWQMTCACLHVAYVLTKYMCHVCCFAGIDDKSWRVHVSMYACWHVILVHTNKCVSCMQGTPTHYCGHDAQRSLVTEDKVVEEQTHAKAAMHKRKRSRLYKASYPQTRQSVS